MACSPGSRAADQLQLPDPSRLDIQDRESAGVRKQPSGLPVPDSAVTGILIGLAVTAAVALARWLGGRRPAPAPGQDREPGLDRAQCAVTAARGNSATPRQPVGFGRA